MPLPGSALHLLTMPAAPAVRSCMQVIPAAAECVSTGDEGTSNNKVKERDIHLFLRKVLGNNVPGSAPYPEWGLPEGSIHVGWGGYLAGEARGSGGHSRVGATLGASTDTGSTVYALFASAGAKPLPALEGLKPWQAP